MTTRGVRRLCFASVLLVFSALPALAAAPAVRIVRLSVAQGDVQIDRNSGDGWEQALNNMPVVGGARIFAGDNSKAEIEFEDGSSVRLVGPAQIALKELSLSADGAPVTHVEIDSGLVYVDARLTDHADFSILTSTGESFNVLKPSQMRFKVDEQVATLSLTSGELQVPKEGGASTLQAGQTYSYLLGQPESVVRSATVQPSDSWDQQREAYNDQNASAGAQYSGTDDVNAPGVADLGYYGSYDNVPGCGDCWQPAGVGPDWDPYDNGAWSYYDDWGWTFVSAYPWGWAPFYYGDWCYVGGRGWWWHPGPWHGHGPLGGWHPLPYLASAPHGFHAPHPPAHLSHGTVAVAGSNLRVGPIDQTHAAAFTSRASAAAPSVAAHPSAAGAASSFVHSPVEATHGTPFISGMRGTYRLSNPTAGGRTDYRLSAGATPHFEGSSAAPRTYAYGGSSSAPRTFTAPSEAAPHISAPPAISAPHSSSGTSFHGESGGGFHGGGGGGGHR